MDRLEPTLFEKSSPGRRGCTPPTGGVALVDPFTAGYFRRRFGAVVQPVDRAPCYEIALFAPRHPVHARVAVRFGELLDKAICAA